MPERSLLDIIRAAITEVDPGQLPEAEQAARAYLGATDAERGTRTTRREPAGAAEPALGPLAVAVGAALRGTPLLSGPPSARRRLAAWWHRLHSGGRPELDSAPPPVREVDAARLEAAAIVAARERGASDELATAIGAALVRHWPRRT